MCQPCGNWTAECTCPKRERALSIVNEAEGGQEATETGQWTDGCEAIPSGYKTPDSYDVDRSGVWLLRETKDGDTRAPVTSAPLAVTAVYIDPDGNQLVELVWRDKDRWVTRTVPRSVAKSGRRMVTALGDAGLPVTDADSRQAERWLARVETHNQGLIPRRQLARCLGWQPDGEFVTGQDQPRRVEPAWPEQAGALAAHHPAGSFGGWQQVVSALAGYPVAVVVLSAAFAPALLDVLGLDSFTVDVSGRSTRGKTTVAKVVLSAWADPSERADGMFSWRTTMLAVEKRLNLVRGLPVVIDETRVVKFPELVDQVLYQVPKNHGQARGGGWPSMLPFQTVVLSTGEQSALSFTTHQGAGARVLAVTRPPFPTGEHVGAAVAAVGRGICEHYGHAGPRFVASLREVLAEPGGPDRLRHRHLELTGTHQGTTDLSARRAPMVAALHLAAELAHDLGVVPLPPPETAIWAELFHAEDQVDDRPEMALDVVREFVAANAAGLWKGAAFPEATAPAVGGWVGRRLVHDGQNTVALLPGKLRDVLQRAGYALDAVLPGWQETGSLVRSNDKRAPWTPTHRLDGSKTRLYVFTPGVIHLTEAGDEE